jgi:sulfur carrier protein ThiS
MRITIRPQGKEIELAGRRCASDVLRSLDILPGTALIIRSGELVSEHEMLEAEDCIEIRSVISGGV